MKHKGPILTLAAGALLAAVLMVLNLTTTSASDDGGYGATGDAATSPPAASTAPTGTPSAAATSTPVAEAPATYAGNVAGGGATIAIAVKDGTAIAYLCDGRSAEAWLQGTAVNGALALTGTGNARLSGIYRNGVAQGTVVATGKQFAFSVRSVKPPSGLYRAAANVTNAQIVGGWIVLEDGRQVGVLRIGSIAQPAPALNLSTRSVTVNGADVAVNVVDGTRL